MQRSSVCSLQSGNSDRHRRRDRWSRSMCRIVGVDRAGEQVPARPVHHHRPVKTLAVEGDDRGGARQSLPERGQHGRLLRVVPRQQQLNHEPPVDRPQQPSQKQGAARQPASLQIEKQVLLRKTGEQRIAGLGARRRLNPRGMTSLDERLAAGPQLIERQADSPVLPGVAGRDFPPPHQAGDRLHGLSTPGPPCRRGRFSGWAPSDWFSLVPRHNHRQRPAVERLQPTPQRLVERHGRLKAQIS